MITTSTGAKKLESSDNWREIFPNPGTSAAGAHNASVDAHDRIQAEVAPIINGKRCSLGAASGDYVLLRNSTIAGKTDGAYQAAKAIPANTDLDSTYLGSAITGGLVNELNSNIIGVANRMNSQANMTGDIMQDALNSTDTRFFHGSGSSYTGTVPNEYFKYATFIVTVRGINRFILAISENGEVAVNSYNGVAWYGWRILNQFIHGLSQTGVNITPNYTVNDSMAVSIPSGYTLVSLTPRFVEPDVIMIPIGISGDRLYYRLENKGNTNYGMRTVMIDTLFVRVTT